MRFSFLLLLIDPKGFQKPLGSITYGCRSKKNVSYKVLPTYTIKIKMASGTRSSTITSSFCSGSGTDTIAQRIAAAISTRTRNRVSFPSTFYGDLTGSRAVAEISFAYYISLTAQLGGAATKNVPTKTCQVLRALFVAQRLNWF